MSDTGQEAGVAPSADSGPAEAAAANKPVLEPEELEALMAKVAPDEHADALFASLPEIRQPAEVQAFDFDGNEENGPSRFPLFVNLQERFIEGLKEHWEDLLQRKVETRFVEMGQRKYQEMIAEDVPQVYFAYEVEGFGRMMLSMNLQLVIGHVDAMLGGEGEGYSDTPATTLSPVEARLSMRIARQIERQLEACWLPIELLNFESYKIDTDAQFIALAAAGDPCFFVRFEATLSESLSGMVTLIYPRAFLEPMLDNLRSSMSDEPKEDDDEWQQELQASLDGVPVTLQLELGTCRMEIGRFLALAPGDFLPLSKKESDLCTLKLNRLGLFMARPGSQDGMLAAELVEDIVQGGAS